MTQADHGDPLDAPVHPRPDGQPQYPTAPVATYPTAPVATYGVAGPQYVYLVPPPKNDLAVWSLVTGILSWVVCPLILGIAAIVTGSAGRRAVQGGQANNPGMATAGLILGWVNVGLTGALLALWILVPLAAFAGAAFSVSAW